MLVVVVELLMLAACSTGPECGPGTHLDGDVCLPDADGGVTCGPGTHLDGSVCVPDVGPGDTGSPAVEDLTAESFPLLWAEAFCALADECFNTHGYTTYECDLESRANFWGPVDGCTFWEEHARECLENTRNNVWWNGTECVSNYSENCPDPVYTNCG